MFHLKLILCILILNGLCNERAFGFALGIGDLLTSTRDIAKGVAQDAVNYVPTPKGLFDLGKQSLAGYPFEFVSSSINQLCSAAVSTKVITPKISPDINKMNFQLRTPCKNYEIPLTDVKQLIAHPQFDANKKLVILASGWTTTINKTDAIDTIGKAYLCRGDVNFLAVDAASYVDTLYTWSAFNTEDIGVSIAKALVELSKLIKMENIHLIGHSLGAHIVGSAGRNYYYETGNYISRITGLDPAKPCFNEGENLSGLTRSDAKYVDIIHSNPGVLGKRDPLGDADFYPGGLDPLPNGCLDVMCAHARSWEYYAETVYPGNENNFMGVRCTSLTKLRSNKCPGKEYPMGYATPNDIKGNFFLEINAKEPFGKGGTKERLEKNKNCGLCSS